MDIKIFLINYLLISSEVDSMLQYKEQYVNLSECFMRFYKQQLTDTTDVTIALDNRKSSVYYLDSILDRIDKVKAVYKYTFLLNNNYDYNRLNKKSARGVIVIADSANADLFEFIDVLKYQDVKPVFLFYNVIDSHILSYLIMKCLSVGLYKAIVIGMRMEDVVVIRGAQSVQDGCRIVMGVDEKSCFAISQFSNFSYPNERPDFKGCRLNVSTMIIPPSAMLENGKIDGFETQLIYTLAEDMNFKANIIFKEDLEWGELNNDNQTWDGLIGNVFTGKSEIAYGVI